MVQRIIDYVEELGLESSHATWTGTAAAVIGLLLVSLIGYFVTRYILMRILSHYIRNNRFKWDNRMLERRVFHRMCHVVPALIIYIGAAGFGRYQNFLERVGSIYMILVFVMVIHAFLNAIGDIYNSYEISRRKPIKGYLQGAMVFAYVIGGIVILSQILNQSPVILLSGIGAMMAVVILVFQDSILGFVAGIQLASNDMIRIGDWIEVPNHNANGEVTEISLTTVKVENFNRTITTIPPHALVKNSFINWRGMLESGGRRIMRSVYIDTGSIRFCTEEMLERFRGIHYLKDYIEERKREIDAYNTEHNIDQNEPVNGRRMTNIGTFRAYISRYLRNNPNISQASIQMVRPLPPGEHGLPLEIYVFANTTDWVTFEGVQADIFDHILAIAPRFDLRVYQAPGSYDLRQGLASRQDNQTNIDWPGTSE